MITGTIAALVGLAVAVLGWLAGGIKESTDPSMVFEGRVAVAFGLILYAAPLWLAQLVLTLVSTVFHDATGWLWLWLVVAPMVGVVRLSARATPDPGRGA